MTSQPAARAPSPPAAGQGARGSAYRQWDVSFSNRSDVLPSA
jgi:hypothetical protein